MLKYSKLLMLMNQLLKTKYHVRMASNGKEALEVIQKEELDGVEWFDLEEVYKACLPPRNEKFCVPMGGLEIVRGYVKQV